LTELGAELDRLGFAENPEATVGGIRQLAQEHLVLLNRTAVAESYGVVVDALEHNARVGRLSGWRTQCSGTGLYRRSRRWSGRPIAPLVLAVPLLSMLALVMLPKRIPVRSISSVGVVTLVPTVILAILPLKPCSSPPELKSVSWRLPLVVSAKVIISLLLTALPRISVEQLAILRLRTVGMLRDA
jgi:hypothetical protein